MQRTLTITVDETVYRDLEDQVGADNISQFIEDLLRPRLATPDEFEAEYRAMANDPERERTAAEWADALLDQTG